jgi:hypothetical protein
VSILLVSRFFHHLNIQHQLFPGGYVEFHVYSLVMGFDSIDGEAEDIGDFRGSVAFQV